MRTDLILIQLCIYVVGLVNGLDIDDIEIRKHLQERDNARDFDLIQLSYDEIVDVFSLLAKKYPDHIRVHDAREEMSKSGINLPNTRCFANGESARPCKYIYAELTNFMNPAHVNFTQSFYSGNFHGDEVIGPNVVTYLAKYILERPRIDILQYSYIVLLPFGNPSGYFTNQREEKQYINTYEGADKSFDMNRDFPYDQSANSCFKTAGARVINYIWQKHLFTAAITFHGGMTAIGWPWGSTNHVNRNHQGDLSPDQQAMLSLGKRMSESADNNLSIPRYPFNTLTNAIYEVEGSFEDWSYAASWEGKFNRNVFPACKGISEEEMRMNDSIARSMTYLIETSADKGPIASSYGRWIEVDQPSKGIGHVSRNIRLVLDFIENLTPFYVSQMTHRQKFAFFLRWDLNGCENVDTTTVFLREKDPLVSNVTRHDYTSLKQLVEDGFVSYKSFSNYPGNIKHSDNKNTLLIEFEDPIERTIDIALVSSCDSIWKQKQYEAKPTDEPQSHFVRSRIDENYMAENNGYFINSNAIIVQTYGPFLLMNSTITINQQADEETRQSDGDYLPVLSAVFLLGVIGSIFFYRNFKRMGQVRIEFEELRDEELQIKNSQSNQQ